LINHFNWKSQRKQYCNEQKIKIQFSSFPGLTKFVYSIKGFEKWEHNRIDACSLIMMIKFENFIQEYQNFKGPWTYTAASKMI
jgi:hypothetical protein